MEKVTPAQLSPQAVELLRDHQPTPSTVRGPMYRKGAPFRDRLARVDEPGVPLVVSGRVVGLADRRPLAGATLDVWQTNRRGLYSNMLGLRPKGDPKAFWLRGKFRPDEQGRYEIHTIVPGRYPLGPLSRPRHIHLIARCPGYRELTTQAYFSESEHLGRDPFVKEALIVPLLYRGRRVDPAQLDDKSSPFEEPLRAVFDIVLEAVRAT